MEMVPEYECDRMTSAGDRAVPLVAHIVYRFDYGGLENGLVNLINTMPDEAASHVVISLTEPGEIVQRITRDNVEIYDLKKQPGKDPAAYVRLYKLLRKLKPDVVHTRNLGTLDCQFVAFLAGVPWRFHGEHGWDIHDPDGKIKKYHYLRKAMNPLIHQFVVLSRELQSWLVNVVGIPSSKVQRICNGVDVSRFEPQHELNTESGEFVFGSVTRFTEIKDPLNTIRAFVHLVSQRPAGALQIKLLMVGDGPLLKNARELISESDMCQHIFLAGSQLDVSSWLRKMDVFVMGSKREGISNTILEAMATGIPVIATDTGGNPELIDDGSTGTIVTKESPCALATAMQTYLDDTELVNRHGEAGRTRVLELFSLKRMVECYIRLYQQRQIAQD